MELVVVDVEINNNKNRKKNNFFPEIIEIGAQKIKYINNKWELQDTFHTYIQPQFENVTYFITELTGISVKDVENAPFYPEAIDLFLKWVGKRGKIWSWSVHDKLAFIRNGKKHKLNVKWTYQFEDAQQLYTLIHHRAGKMPISLKKALHRHGIGFEGEEHNALDDAKNTAKLLITLLEKKVIHKKTV